MEHLDKCAGVTRELCNCGYYIRRGNLMSEPHRTPPELYTIDEFLEANHKRGAIE